MAEILKCITAALVAAVLIPLHALAYDVVNLPNSMTFAEALGIYDFKDISAAMICDTERNIYRNLSREEINDFFTAASQVKVWRKINPTPFRGAYINFKAVNGAKSNYSFTSGIQIGLYGTDNYVCYMPAHDDAVELTYMLSEFYDSDDAVYGGSDVYACTTRDFLKLPEAEWAAKAVKTAAAKSLVPYEFTDKYTKDITREELAILIANLIKVAGNYADVDDYIKDETGSAEYDTDVFADCAGRSGSSSIHQLYALGILTGRGNGLFDPDGKVTRQEMAAFITRVAERNMYVGTNYTLNASDKAQVALWANFYVRWVLDNGIMTLDGGGRFYPQNNLTVEQAITTIDRLYDMITV